MYFYFWPTDLKWKWISHQAPYNTDNIIRNRLSGPNITSPPRIPGLKKKNTIKCIIILSSQYQLDPDSLPEHTRPGPSIAAVTRVNLIIIITTIPTITSSQIYKNDGNPLKGWKPFLHFSSARSCQRRLHPRCSSGYLHHLCNHLYHDHDHYNRYHRHCHI